YKGIQLIRQTRAVQLMEGIVMLLLITQVSEWLHFNTIHFILRNTVQVGMVALSVVFQPELRRALEQMGRKGFVKIFNFENLNTENSVAKVIDEITKAVQIVAQNRIGALIVIERD